MTVWALLAPGPSATAEQAEAVAAAGLPLGAIGNAFELAPEARFIASTDRGWWRKYPEALDRGCVGFCMMPFEGVEEIRMPHFGLCNSGVLGLECAKRLGATRIVLFGFDMHGGHFFGAYTNGLRNTAEHQRIEHLRQYARWKQANKNIDVVNCTRGSALTCFRVADDLHSALHGRKPDA